MVVILGLLAITARAFVPIPIGKSATYWEFACGVELESFEGYFPYTQSRGIYPDRDGWYLYFYTEHHGRHIYKIKKENLEIDLDELFSSIEEEVTTSMQEGISENDVLDKNLRRNKCKSIGEKVSLDKDEFLSELNAHSIRSFDDVSELNSVDRQWSRSKKYWISVVFEAFFIPFWWVFTFHGRIFGGVVGTKVFRFALSPLLLLTPYLMGYAPYMFSSGFSGGILYPLLATLASIPFYALTLLPPSLMEIIVALDASILKIIPKPLSLISQIPYAARATSYSGGISPSVLILYALCIIGICYVIKRIQNARF